MECLLFWALMDGCFRYAAHLERSGLNKQKDTEEFCVLMTVCYMRRIIKKKLGEKNAALTI